MWGYDVKCKDEYFYGCIALDKAYDVIQLTEPHEAGEIINDYWLIENDEIESFRKFKKDDFVRVIDIRYFDLFETDINYDNRKDLLKYGTSFRQFSNHKAINVYNYSYKH